MPGWKGAAFVATSWGSIAKRTATARSTGSFAAAGPNAALWPAKLEDVAEKSCAVRSLPFRRLLERTMGREQARERGDPARGNVSPEGCGIEDESRSTDDVMDLFLPLLYAMSSK